jgi:hypothetical protein
VGDDWTAAYTKSGAKVIAESDSELPAGLGQPEKGVTAMGEVRPAQQFYSVAG